MNRVKALRVTNFLAKEIKCPDSFYVSINQQYAVDNISPRLRRFRNRQWPNWYLGSVNVIQMKLRNELRGLNVLRR